jgi:hypothetical protein
MKMKTLKLKFLGTRNLWDRFIIICDEIAYCQLEEEREGDSDGLFLGGGGSFYVTKNYYSCRRKPDKKLTCKIRLF